MLLSSGAMGLVASCSPFFCSPVRAGSPEDDEESYIDPPIELDSFNEPGNDDEEASDLVVGEEIDVLGDAVGDNEPIELDLGTLVGEDATLPGADDGDSGFEVDPAIGLTLPDALLPDDGGQGLDDGAIVIDESKFPSLELDDGSEGIAAEREISLGNANDEASVPLAEVPWHAEPSAATLEAFSALTCSGEAVVAGSSDLLWFRSGSPNPLRVAVDGSAISDLVLLGHHQEIALVSTQSGQLFRRARFASQAEQLTRFREQLKSPPNARTRLSFGGSLGAVNGRVLLWIHDGPVLDVLDSGDRFARLELDGNVQAIARESATLLLARGGTRTLFTLDHGSGHSQPITGSALLVARSATPLLATCGAAVGIAEHGRALLVSPDGGRTFQRVPGSASVTAIAGAEVSGSARFFAALYRETSDQSEILIVDPELGRAECIARLEVSQEQSTTHAIDRGEWAKVACLSWDAASGRLWAAGGFGVASFSPQRLA